MCAKPLVIMHVVYSSVLAVFNVKFLCKIVYTTECIHETAPSPHPALPTGPAFEEFCISLAEMTASE